ncbi:DinB family protein [uncultured Croceitalea sp.]|uniref:DinB family protein n=1 Tax=uncultured Croceitalea sp. TaxID=1798908 RepID=UPI00374E6867
MNSTSLNSKEYNAYYQPYISTLGKVDLLTCLNDDLESFSTFINKVPNEKLKHAYDANKWSIAEVLIHLLDAERIFQYRALRFARKDTTEIPGFDQDLYVPNSRANERSKESIAEEFKAIRNATITLFNSFNHEELTSIGNASGSKMSVRALGFIICGHLKHHKRIIEERYL